VASAVLRALLLRAFVLWILLRVLVGAAGVWVESLGGSPPDSPIGIVLLTVATGLVDVRRRRERALWANLGISLPVLAGIFGTIAVTGEVVLALLRR
jgi:hypothetical protein